MNRRTFVALVAFLLAPACPGTAQAPAPTLRVDVSPRLQLLQLDKGASVLIRVTIPRNPQNRVGCVTVDGPMFRSSCWENGPQEAPTKEFRYSGLPGGSYTVVGEVQWVEEATGERKSVVKRDRFEIRIGGEDEAF